MKAITRWKGSVSDKSQESMRERKRESNSRESERATEKEIVRDRQKGE